MFNVEEQRNQINAMYVACGIPQPSLQPKREIPPLPKKYHILRKDFLGLDRGEVIAEYMELEERYDLLEKATETMMSLIDDYGYCEENGDLGRAFERLEALL